MYRYIFRKSAEKQLKKLPPIVQQQIIRKMSYFISMTNPLIFASNLKDYELGSYRFRIGDYRVIFDVEDEDLIILKIGHRKDIYK